MGRAFEFRKARKMKRWSSMAKTFTRIGKDIVIAVKEGGPDPSSNSRLRAIIQNAKAANMPKANVESAIKRASSKDQDNYIEVVLEGYGMHGVAVLVECTTDNNKRTVANVRSYFSKTGGSLGTNGMLDFIFERKCIFKVVNKEGLDIEELELELIDFGVDDVFLDDETGLINIYGEFTSYGDIQKYLEENDFEIDNSGFERIPLDTKTLTEEEGADIDKLLEKLEEDDDVQNVYHNMVLA
ncbi:MAG: YebC/PmpR family DNA-binding transcriptional regulator [Cytophagales bacterium]|nr:YebC/PmpR family DNA-binding transcriptional regulator [Cytophagales bacterium]